MILETKLQTRREWSVVIVTIVGKLDSLFRPIEGTWWLKMLLVTIYIIWTVYGDKKPVANKQKYRSPEKMGDNLKDWEPPLKKENNNNKLVVLCDLFGMIKWRFQRI